MATRNSNPGGRGFPSGHHSHPHSGGFASRGGGGNPRFGKAAQGHNPSANHGFFARAAENSSVPFYAPADHRAAPMGGSGLAPASEPANKTVELATIPIPEDRIYDLNAFQVIQESHPSCCPQGIMRIARSLWKSMPEHVDKLHDSASNLRESLFADSDTVGSSKVLQDRKLHHEVRGVLGKVTESNLEMMKKLLIELPVRQSTKEEIHEVIDVFFRKSTQPEDKRYTPLYVLLLVYLIDTIGKESQAGRMIRTEIISQCKETFTNASIEFKKMEESTMNMPADEAEIIRMTFNNKQKSNITFLGLMFVNDLVTEKITVSVLDGLIYSRGRRVPAEADIINFIELLLTCGPHFSPMSKAKLDQFRLDMEQLANSYKSIRIQVLLQNAIETMDNNWIPLHGRDARRQPAAGPMGSPNHHHGSHGSPMGSSSMSNSINFGRHPGPHGSPIQPGSPMLQGTLSKNPTPAPPPRPEREEFWKIMDEYFKTNNLDECVSVMGRLPTEKDQLAYCMDWYFHRITVLKFAKDWSRLGDLFDRLVDEGAVDADVPQKALLLRVETDVCDDNIMDGPRYFEALNAIVSAGSHSFPPVLHYKFLMCMVRHHCPPELIQMFIEEVDVFQTASLGESVSGASRTSPMPPSGSHTPAMGSSHSGPEEIDSKHLEDHRVRDRLHLLPALLRYTYPMLSGTVHTKEEQESMLHMGERSVELLVFRELVDDDGAQLNLSLIPQLIKENPMNAYPIVSALFTYMRFNLHGLSEKYKATMKKLFCSPQVSPVLLLMDVFLQWRQLESPLEEFSIMVQKARALLPRQDVVEKLKDRLRQKDIGADPKVLSMLEQLDNSASTPGYGGHHSDHRRDEPHRKKRA